MKEITENQFWQLVGIITAARENRKIQEALEKAYCNIIGEKVDDLTRFSDYVWEDTDIVSALKEHLPHDDISVEETDQLVEAK